MGPIKGGVRMRLNILHRILRPLSTIRRITSMSQVYVIEEQVAVTAVRRACQLTSSVFTTLVSGESIIKDDKSPVTSSLFYVIPFI